MVWVSLMVHSLFFWVSFMVHSFFMMLLLNVDNKQSFIERSDVQYTDTHIRVCGLVDVSTFLVHAEILLFRLTHWMKYVQPITWNFIIGHLICLKKFLSLRKKKKDAFGSLMRKFLFFRLQQSMTRVTNSEGTEQKLILKCKIKACNQEKKSFLFLYMPSKFVIVTLLNTQCFNLSQNILRATASKVTKSQVKICWEALNIITA